MLQQDKLAGLSGLVDLASVDLLELEVSAGTQAPDKALLAAVQHLVETLEPLHSLGPLVSGVRRTTTAAPDLSRSRTLRWSCVGISG